MRFTVELTSSRPIVAWRSLRQVPHKRLSDATYWIACTRWGKHPLRERKCAPRFWGGSGESAPLQTSTSIRLSVQFFPADEPTCSLVVWACVVPASVMQNEVLLGCDSGMRFNNRTYRFLPPRAMDHRMFGEIEWSHHAPAGVRAYAVNRVTSDGGFHLCYDGAVGVNLSDEPKMLAVNLVCSNGSQALTGPYLVDMPHQSDLPSEEEHFVAFG